MTTKRAAIVDVDGTVVDSNHLHVVTWWEAFRQAGRHASMREIHRTVGLGSGNLIEHLLGDDRGPDGDDPLAATHHALYATYFERLPALDDAGDLPRALARRGWKIVLATSASGAELSALRGAIDADDVILGAASADDVDDGKAAPNPARQAGELAGVPSERAVFGGDTVWDMKAALRDGVVPVAVLPGGIPRADLEAAAPARCTEIPATSADTWTPASSPTASQQGRPQSRAVDRAQRLVVQGGSAPGYRFVEARARSRTVPAPVCGGHAEVAMAQAFPDDGADSRTARNDS